MLLFVFLHGLIFEILAAINNYLLIPVNQRDKISFDFLIIVRQLISCDKEPPAADTNSEFV